jgi:hypothetical protein
MRALIRASGPAIPVTAIATAVSSCGPNTTCGARNGFEVMSEGEGGASAAGGEGGYGGASAAGGEGGYGGASGAPGEGGYGGASGAPGEGGQGGR